MKPSNKTKHGRLPKVIAEALESYAYHYWQTQQGYVKKDMEAAEKKWTKDRKKLLDWLENKPKKPSKPPIDYDDMGPAPTKTCPVCNPDNPSNQTKAEPSPWWVSYTCDE